MTINQIYNDYIQTKELTLAKHTVTTYHSAYNKHIAPYFGTRDIGTINYIDYQKFADRLLRSGLQVKTVKNILVLISSIYTYAIKCEYYNGHNYPRLVELPQYDNKYYVNFSAAIQKQYLLALKNADEPIYKDMFLFLLHGRRLSEVLDLEWEYLDLHQGIVYYPASKNKAKKHLSYELTTELIEVLKTYQAEAIDRQKTIFIKGHVFLNPNTLKRFNNLRKPWKRLLEKNNLQYTKLHNIRHILTTYLLNELKMPLDTVSFVLGHSSTDITKRYVTFKPKIAKEAIDTLFSDFKTKGDKYIENLNDVLIMGECVQKILFSDKKRNEVNITT